MKNWKKVKLGTLISESKLVSENPSTDNRIRVKLNLLGIEKRPVTKDKKGATTYYTRKAGQFIYGKQNLHKGAFGIVPNELDGFESSSDIPAFDVDESCYPEWIFYFFKKGNFFLKLDNLAKGVGSRRIQPQQIYQLDIFLPTKLEQRKILDELAEIETKNKKLLTEINTQELSLKRLRQSILNDAVRGTLTKEWRMGYSNIESAKELLNQINKERRRLILEKKLKKERPSTMIKNGDAPFSVPSNWVWCRFGELVKFMAYGTSQKTNENSNDVPVLRMGNISSEGKIIYDNLKYISPEHKDLPKLFLEYGDIVFNRTNSYDLVGKSAVFDRENEKYSLASYLIKISLFSQYINPYYLNNYIMSSICRTTQIEPQIIAQTNQANFSGSKLKNIVVPLPPITEQMEIVRRIDKLNLTFEKLEGVINSNKIKSEKLTQSLLLELLGNENNIIITSIPPKRTVTKAPREVRYNSNTTNMDLTEILKVNGKLHAEDLLKMSKHFDEKNIGDSIDKFYADLKFNVEVNKSIKESTDEKGYLELV